MSAALAYLEDDLPMPRPARHLYLVAVDGHIVDSGNMYATTLHLNLDAAGTAPLAPIETVLFTDGLKRVLQTKKSIAENGIPKMAVSGQVVFDAMGRTVQQFYPVAVPSNRPTHHS